ncbi:MAG: hypothetical protein QOK10_29, partial [Pseudonocardiales bacterium]|nr:hypothetical protein [Pseudonocardiales bacterium]
NAVGTPALLPDGTIAQESLLGGTRVDVGGSGARELDR